MINDGGKHVDPKAKPQPQLQPELELEPGREYGARPALALAAFGGPSLRLRQSLKQRQPGGRAVRQLATGNWAMGRDTRMALGMWLGMEWDHLPLATSR
ncbi:hypothetical protein ACLKA6_003562 [Drosophila palustris]